jgi:hypothetical protein
MVERRVRLTSGAAHGLPPWIAGDDGAAVLAHQLTAVEGKRLDDTPSKQYKHDINNYWMNIMCRVSYISNKHHLAYKLS